MRLLALLALAVRFALHRRPPGGGDGPDTPGRTPDGGDGSDTPSQQRGGINAGDGVDSAQDATGERADAGEPNQVVSDRDVHGALRETEREVNVDEVWSQGEMYFQDDGQIVKILDNGDGTYSVVVRDPSNPSGRPTTVIGNLTESQLQSRLDRGKWFE